MSLCEGGIDVAKFCKNCGSELNEGQDVCLKCGVKVGKGTSNNNGYCYNCGAEIGPNQDVCLKCGVKVKGFISNNGSKSKMAAGLLGIFLGAFGIHNFYLGYTGKAIAQLLITCLSCGILSFVSAIWGLIEGIMILCDKIDCDANGNRLCD